MKDTSTSAVPFGRFRTGGDKNLPYRDVAQFGSASALGAGGRRFKSCHPDSLNMTKMKFYSVEYWQENFDELMDKVENGETIGIENNNGDKAIMVPADDELIRIYREFNNEAC